VPCLVSLKRRFFELSASSSHQAALSMAGGERKRPRSPRFADRKRPPSEQNKTALELRGERLQVPPCFVSNDEMVFCPFHGRKLEGEGLKCPTCRRGYVDRRVVYTPGSLIAVDYRAWLKHWRRVLFRRMKPPFHSHVRYLSEPHVDIQVIWHACRQDKDGISFSMASGSETNAKVVETTWAVEDFCSFGVFENGYLSAKLTESGDVLMVVPPVEVAHVKSNVTGQKCRIEFGWVLLTSGGTFNKAENMPEPAQGWEHVEARARDVAAGMLVFQNGIDPEMVARSEAILRLKYDSDEAFLRARQSREDNRQNVLPPHIHSAAELESSRQAVEDERLEKACQVARFYGEQPELWDQVQGVSIPMKHTRTSLVLVSTCILSCMCMLHCYVIVGKNCSGHAQGFLMHKIGQNMHRVCILFSGCFYVGLLHMDHLGGICLWTACGLLFEMAEHIFWLILRSTDQLHVLRKARCSNQGIEEAIFYIVRQCLFF
jgi:hypothetical protein